MGGGVAVAIALSDGEQLPELASKGYNSMEEVKGAAPKIDMTGKMIFAPGPDPSVYAYVKATVQRNLFGILLESSNRIECGTAQSADFSPQTGSGIASL